MRYLLFILITCLFSTSCKKSSPYDFSWSDDPVAGTPITFYSNAPDNSNFYWKVATVGVTLDSKDAHPSFTLWEGVYTVSLSINGDGRSTVTKQISVGKTDEFEYTGSRVPYDTIRFDLHPLSNNDTFLWNFGDGTTSTDTDPYHIYKAVGDYKVTCLVNGHRNAITNNPIIRIVKDPVYTYEIAAARMWEIQDRWVATNFDTTIYYPATSHDFIMKDKLTIKFSHSWPFWGDVEMFFSPQSSKNNILVYSSDGARVILTYDYVADTARIQSVYGTASLPPPNYTYYTTALSK